MNWAGAVLNERIGRWSKPDGVRRHILGLGGLLAAIVPAYVAFRGLLPDGLAFVEADVRDADHSEVHGGMRHPWRLMDRLRRNT